MRKVLMGMMLVIGILLLPIQAKAAGENFTNATEVTIGQSYHDTIAQNAYNDYYKITIPSSGRLKYTITIDNDLKYRMNLYDENQNEISGSYYNDPNKSRSNEYWYDLEKGTYFIRIKDSNYSTGSYNVDFSFTPSGENVTEPNNNFVQASEVALDTQYYGFIADNDYNDYYKVTIPSSGRLKFNISVDSDLKYRMNLYADNENKTEISNSYYNDPSKSRSDDYWYDLEKGTYYIRIKDNNYSTGAYKFNFTFTPSGENVPEPNNTLSDAAQIALNTQYNGFIADNDYNDCYKITVPAGRYTIQVQVPEDLNYQLNVYDGNQKEVDGSKYNDPKKSKTNDFEYDLEAGTYYIRVKDNNYSTGAFSFIIKEAHKHKYQQSITKATTKKNGSIKYVCACGDVDAEKTETIYRIKKIQLSQTKFKYNRKNRKPKVTVYDSNGYLIASSNYKVVYPKKCKKVGKYKVKIIFKGNYSGTVKKKYKIVRR